MPGEVLKILKRYSQPNLSYWRKTNRGGALWAPLIRSRVIISAKNISRELGEPDFSRGRDQPHSIDLPREHIVWSFRGDTNASYWAPQLAPISNTIAVSIPYFDSSGWFLIEKTTILTNSCCLYVQPTFGYLWGSAFGVALRTEGWLLVWPAVWQAAVLPFLWPFWKKYINLLFFFQISIWCVVWSWDWWYSFTGNMIETC